MSVLARQVSLVHLVHLVQQLGVPAGMTCKRGWYDMGIPAAFEYRISNDAMSKYEEDNDAESGRDRGASPRLTPAPSSLLKRHWLLPGGPRLYYLVTMEPRQHLEHREVLAHEGGALHVRHVQQPVVLAGCTQL